MSTYGELTPYGVGGTYVDTPAVTPVPTLKAVTVDPYTVAVAYGEVVTYVDSVVSDAVYSAENILTFSSDASSGITVATDLLAFSEVANIVHDASNSLTFSEPTYARGKDTLSFSDSADYVRNAVDTLTFSETLERLHGVGTDELTFTETVSYARNQYDVLAFSDSAYVVTVADDALTFSETAGVIFAASNDISFSEPLIAELPLTDQLTWLETVTHGTHLVTPELLSFEQEVTWNRAKSVAEAHSLAFYEVGRYTTLHDGVITGSGGTGHALPTPSEEVAGTLTVGTHSFRVADSYDLETEFGNGTYLNAGSKYSLQLGRPLDLVGDWQLELRALVGTKQLVTNLLPNPFEAFITDETSLDSEGISLVFYSLEHDTRGAT